MRFSYRNLQCKPLVIIIVKSLFFWDIEKYAYSKGILNPQY